MGEKKPSEVRANRLHSYKHTTRRALTGLSDCGSCASFLTANALFVGCRGDARLLAAFTFKPNLLLRFSGLALVRR